MIPNNTPKANATTPTLAALTVIVSTFVALLGAELVLRWIAQDEYFVWPPDLERTFPALPEVMPGVHGESRFVTNEYGIRGRTFSNEDGYRILAMGGSTTECLFLDESEAWPRLLEAELNRVFPGGGVWVGSVGKAGQTARHHALQAENLPPQYPTIDAALILVGLNDFLVRLRRDTDFRPLAEETPQRRRELRSQAFDSAPGFDADYPFYKRTALWRALRRIKPRPSATPRGPDQSAGASYLVRNREYRRRAPRVLETLPDLTVALDDYAETLNRTVTALESQDVRPIFVTQPTMWREDLPPELERLLWFGRRGMEMAGADYYSAAALAEGMRLHNEVLLDVCRQRGAVCVDLAALLPKDTTVFYDDAHFNEAGARRVAAVLGEALARMPDIRSEMTP